MSVEIECKACQFRLVIPGELWERRFAGRLQAIKCKKCGGKVVIDGRASGSPGDTADVTEAGKLATAESGVAAVGAEVSVEAAPAPAASVEASHGRALLTAPASEGPGDAEKHPSERPTVAPPASVKAPLLSAPPPPIPLPGAPSARLAEGRVFADPSSAVSPSPAKRSTTAQGQVATPKATASGTSEGRGAKEAKGTAVATGGVVGKPVEPSRAPSAKPAGLRPSSRLPTMKSVPSAPRPATAPSRVAPLASAEPADATPEPVETPEAVPSVAASSAAGGIDASPRQAGAAAAAEPLDLDAGRSTPEALGFETVLSEPAPATPRSDVGDDTLTRSSWTSTEPSSEPTLFTPAPVSPDTLARGTWASADARPHELPLPPLASVAVKGSEVTSTSSFEGAGGAPGPKPRYGWILLAALVLSATGVALGLSGALPVSLANPVAETREALGEPREALVDAPTKRELESRSEPNAGPVVGRAPEVVVGPRADAIPAEEAPTQAGDVAPADSSASAHEAPQAGIGSAAPTATERDLLVDRMMKRVGECHLGGRARGEAVLHLRIAPSGRVTDATIEGDAIGQAPVSRCVIAVARALVLPPFDGPDFTTSRPFVFD